MPKCPHCSETIDKLAGFVDQATLEQRLKNQREAKDAEITALTTEVTDLRSKTQGYDAILGERDKLKGELQGIRQREERFRALDEVKLDRSLLEHVEVLYNSATAGVDEPPEFGAWLGEQGKAHPLLAPQIGKAGTTTTTTTAGEGENRLPDAGGGQEPGGPGGKMTPQQVQQYFASSEYAALSREDKRAKIAELKGQAAQGSDATR